MNVARWVLLLATMGAAATQLVGCSSEVVASEARTVDSVWHGYHAEVRVVVYDDMNPNINRRKFALSQDIAQADDAFKAHLNTLAPVQAPMSCASGEKVYVLEIVEAGKKRRYSSANNACSESARYTGYVQTEALAQLADSMASRVN